MFFLLLFRSFGKNIGLTNNFRMDRKMTDLDIEAAQRLRAIWDQRKRERAFTQETASDFLGMNQSSVSMYVRGAIPLGVEATLKFAYFLDVDPREIRPDLPDWVVTPKSHKSDFPVEAVSLLKDFSFLSPNDKQVVQRIVSLMRFNDAR